MRYVVVYDIVLGVFPTHVCKCEICDNFEEAQGRRRDFIKIVNTIHNEVVVKSLIESYECRIYEEIER